MNSYQQPSLDALYTKRNELMQRLYMNNNVNPNLTMKLQTELQYVNSNIAMVESGMARTMQQPQQQYYQQPYQQPYQEMSYGIPQQQIQYPVMNTVGFGKPMPSSCNNNGTDYFAGVDAGKYSDVKPTNNDSKYSFAGIASSYQKSTQGYEAKKEVNSGYERELQEEIKRLKERLKEMENNVVKIEPGYVLDVKTKFFTSDESSYVCEDIDGKKYLYPVKEISSYKLLDNIPFVTGKCENGESKSYKEASSFVLSNVNYDDDLKGLSIVALLNSTCSKSQLVPVLYDRDNLSEATREEMLNDVKSVYELSIGKVEELDPNSPNFFKTLITDTMVEINDDENVDQADLKVVKSFASQFHNFIVEATRDYVNVFFKGCLGLGRGLVTGKFTQEDATIIDEIFNGTSNLVKLTGETLDQAVDYKRYVKDILANSLSTIGVEYSSDDPREIVATIYKKCTLFGVYIPTYLGEDSIEELTTDMIQEGHVSLYSNEKLFNMVDTLYRKACENTDGIYYKEDAHLVFTDGGYNEVSYQIIPSCVTIEREDIPSSARHTYYLRKVSSRF